MKSFLFSPRFSRLAKEGTWIVAGQIAAMLGSLVLVRVLTEYLDPEQYGRMALGLTIGVLVCHLSMSGVMPGIMRYYPIAAEKGDLQRYLAQSLKFMGYGTLATVILSVFALTAAWWFGYGTWLGLIFVAVIFTQISSYNSTLSGVQNAARQRSIVALHSGAEPWLRMAFAVGFIYAFGNSGTVVVTGYAAGIVLILGSQFLFLKRLLARTTGHQNNEQHFWASKMWAYSRPIAIFAIFTWAQANSDRWALALFANTSEVGLFSVLMQLGYMPVALAIGLLTNFVGPILNQRSGEATDSVRNANVHRITWQLTFVCLMVTLLAFILALGLHDWIFSLLVAPIYRSVSYLLPWVLLAGGLVSAGQIMSLKLMTDMNTRALLWPKLGTSVLGVCLNLLGAYYAGLHGIVAAAIIYAVTNVLWLGLLARRKS